MSGPVLEWQAGRGGANGSDFGAVEGHVLQVPDLLGPCHGPLPCLRHGIQVYSLPPLYLPSGAGRGPEGPWLWDPKASMPPGLKTGAQPAQLHGGCLGCRVCLQLPARQLSGS